MNEMSKKIMPWEDVVMSPLVYITSKLLRRIRSRGIYRYPICKHFLFKTGVFPIVNHYYEPLFDASILDKSLYDDRELSGIDWNIEEQLEMLNGLNFWNEIKEVIDSNQNGYSFDITNEMFGPGDCEYWYSIIRFKKPKRIIEVGSGYSTRIAILAIKKNKWEDPSYECEHICIEPYENLWLEAMDVVVMRKKVQNVDRKIFEKLESGDILFIDSSHVIRPQGDVVFEYLELLPRLNEGVIVHIHDIFSPKDYPKVWVNDQIRLWNEQYLVEAFLTSNSDWRIIGALNLLFHKYHRMLEEKFPFLSTNIEPRSLYIIKCKM